MATYNKQTQHVIVWTVIAVLFTILTVFAISFDRIRLLLD